jgi:hypothetical protein
MAPWRKSRDEAGADSLRDLTRDAPFAHHARMLDRSSDQWRSVSLVRPHAVWLVCIAAMSGCLTPDAYNKLAFAPTRVLAGEVQCEVRTSDGKPQLLVHARLRRVGMREFVTEPSDRLLDRQETLFLRPAPARKARGGAEQCLVTAAKEDPASAFFLRPDQAGEPESYRIYRRSPEAGVAPGARVVLPDKIRDRAGLAAFALLAPLLFILDLTPVGWIYLAETRRALGYM